MNLDDYGLNLYFTDTFGSGDWHRFFVNDVVLKPFTQAQISLSIYAYHHHYCLFHGYYRYSSRELLFSYNEAYVTFKIAPGNLTGKEIIKHWVQYVPKYNLKGYDKLKQLLDMA